tara:strand:+ start:132 stop:1163 length:1032 start_codon:yes stop_codon:yes gene_type:complete
MFFLNDKTFKSVLKVLLLLIIFLVLLSYYFINCKGAMSLFEGKGRGRKKKKRRTRSRRLAKKEKKKMKRKGRKVGRKKKRAKRNLRRIKKFKKFMSKKAYREMKRRLKKRIEEMKRKEAALKEKQRIYGNKQSQLGLKLELEYPEGLKQERTESSKYFTRKSRFSQLGHPLCSILNNDPNATTNNKILISEKSDISNGEIENYFNVFGEDKILTCENNNEMKLKAAQEIGRAPSGISVPSDVIVPRDPEGNAKPCGSATRNDHTGKSISYCGGTIEFDSIFGSTVTAKDNKGTTVLSGGRIYPDIYDFTNSGLGISSVMKSFDYSGQVAQVDTIKRHSLVRVN